MPIKDYSGDYKLNDLKSFPENTITTVNSGTFIIGFEFSHSSDFPTMVVGMKYDGRIDIVNTITGAEAVDIYCKLCGLNSIQSTFHPTIEGR